MPSQERQTEIAHEEYARVANENATLRAVLKEAERFLARLRYAWVAPWPGLKAMLKTVRTALEIGRGQ
jgi:hypothetical protein